MPYDVTRTTLVGMTHIPPPAEELRLLDAELWQLDARRAQLLARRAWLVAALQQAWPAPVAPPRPEAPAPRVQNVLLLLGGVLLTIAAMVFTLVSWGHLGIGGRAVVLGAVTLAALAACGGAAEAGAAVDGRVGGGPRARADGARRLRPARGRPRGGGRHGVRGGGVGGTRRAVGRVRPAADDLRPASAPPRRPGVGPIPAAALVAGRRCRSLRGHGRDPGDGRVRHGGGVPGDCQVRTGRRHRRRVRRGHLWRTDHAACCP